VSVTILHGDCRDVLATLPAASVQCCVTSPPYYGLRDYGVDGQIGLEPTPDAYVAQMVAVFRAVRRVLRDDGTLWLNIGDSYAGSRCGPQSALGEMADRSIASQREMRSAGNHVARPGAKPKDLLGIPWLLAFALRADGWFLRSEIIWHKPNPMPESVRDRPTKAHEQVFQLSKRAQYFYDQHATLEGVSPNTHARLSQDVQAQIGSDRAHAGGKTNGRMKAVGRKFDPGQGNKNNPSFDAAMAIMPEQRNARSVWTIATQPYSGAHFATMPPDLAERCIKAGTSERGQCPHCGAPWGRVMDKQHYGAWKEDGVRGDAMVASQDKGLRGADFYKNFKPPVATGWAPSCACPAHDPVPQTVLDPFGGAGTTGLVADRLQRHALMIELNPAYASLARDRIHGDAPLLLSPHA
jgi:DNA modification methylase